MSGRFGFPVFTVALLLLGGIAWLLEVNGMIPFAIPWIPIIVIIAAVLSVGAVIFGRNRDRPGFCPFSAICPFTTSVHLGTEGKSLHIRNTRDVTGEINNTSTILIERLSQYWSRMMRLRVQRSQKNSASRKEKWKSGSANSLIPEQGYWSLMMSQTPYSR